MILNALFGLSTFNLMLSNTNQNEYGYWPFWYLCQTRRAVDQRDF